MHQLGSCVFIYCRNALYLWELRFGGWLGEILLNAAYLYMKILCVVDDVRCAQHIKIETGLLQYFIYRFFF